MSGEERVYHIPVMLEEVLRDLRVKPDGVYVDGTAGGGGHAAAIARQLTAGGRLLATDKDPDAVARAGQALKGLPAEVFHADFTEMGQILSGRNLKADGILLDLGVSGHQLDETARGFSYHRDAPLDMRLSQEGQTAAELVNTLSEEELRTLLYRYGEEPYAPGIAKAIVQSRKCSPIETTLELAEIVSAAVPAKARRQKHPCRRTFQALRIAVNDELGLLTRVLDIALESLGAHGRLVILTFHSLEDRIVKQTFAEWCAGCTCPPDFPVCVCGKTPKGAAVHKKPIIASEEEIQGNPRARSAKLRAFEKY